MEILLTGYKGFLGRELCKWLLDDGHGVYSFDCVSYEEFDRAFSKFRRQGRVDIIVHAGAVADSRESGHRLWEMNYKASMEIADYCEKTDTRLLFVSSAAAIDPDSPYGWSKQCAEFYMRQKVAGMNLCILRPFNIWDFDESCKSNPSIVYKILERRLEQVYFGCIRDFVQLSDVVRGILGVVGTWAAGTFSLGTAEGTDIFDLVRGLCQAAGVSMPALQACPVRKKLVADSDDLLPTWHFTRFSDRLSDVERVFVESLQAK